MSDPKLRMWAILPLRNSQGSVTPIFEHMTRPKDPVANFGWSYVENCSLHRLRHLPSSSKEWQENWVAKGLADIWNKAAWLQNIQPGDYLLYINVPEYDKVTIVQAKESQAYREYFPNVKDSIENFAPCYQYSNEPENSIEGDGFHQICLEPGYWVFNRNDKNIVGEFSASLKNRSNHWEIGDELKKILRTYIENPEFKKEPTQEEKSSTAQETKPRPPLPFAPFKRVGYLIENAIGRGFVGQISVLGAVTFFGILFAAACLFLINSTLPLLDHMWSSLQLVLDPGNLSDVKTSGVPVGAIAVSMGLTLFGLSVFGGIVGILNEFLKTYLKRLQQGLTEIMEKDHIIILGWTKDSISLIEEFIQSNNPVNEIVILSEKASEEIYHQIGELKRQHPRSKTKFIVREGSIHDESRLKKLNLEYSKNIILGAGDDETNFKTLLTLINIFGNKSKDKAQGQVKIMVSIFDPEYYITFNAVKSAVSMVGNLEIPLINKRDILQKIVAQSILDVYTVPIYKDLFSYQGAELYLMAGEEYLKNKKYTADSEISLEISKDFIPLGVRTRGEKGKNIFAATYSQATIKAEKIIYLSTGEDIAGSSEQTQALNVKYSDIKNIYLIGNSEMCSNIQKEIEHMGRNEKMHISRVLPEGEIKNALIFYISGSEEEDVALVKMYLKDAEKNGFTDPNNKIISSLLIDSEAMFRISEKVLEDVPCVISNQIVKRMLAQASVHTELLYIYIDLLGSARNSKEIITISAEPHLKEPKTFKALYQELAGREEPYFLMGYVKGGCTVLCPAMNEKNAENKNEELKFVFPKGDNKSEAIKIDRLILLGERDKMQFDGNEFTLKE